LIFEAIKPFIPVLHWGLLPIFPEHLMENSQKIPENNIVDFYYHYHMLTALLKEVQGEGVKLCMKGDINLNKTLTFSVYSRRWGHKDTYRMERTIDGWNVNHIAINGKCEKNGEGSLLRNLRQGHIFFPKEGVKYALEKYIVTDAMKGHMKKIANDLDRAKHHSYQVIGNYGSVKSHLLAVIAAIIDNPSIIDYIQDEEVKNSFKSNLNRDYAVIQFELQPSQHTLSDFFYDRLEDKLKKKYDIEIPEIDTKEIYDHKEKIKEILDIIKSHDPKMGLVVIIDEISDFLKTKPTKEMKYQDTQFMRVLAQASNQMDFIFMGSMQENVFSSN
jgi:hypothetical protein